MGVESNGGPGTTVTATADDDASAALLPDSLRIPITTTTNNDPDLFVEIFPEELKETSVATLLQVLRDEKAPVALWATAGHLLVTAGQTREALQILHEACDESVANKQEKVRVLAATGIATLLASSNAASTSASSSSTNNDWTAADQKFTQAGKVDTFFPMTWIGRGLLNLQRSSLDQARFFFQTTKKQCGAVLPALLGMAAVLLAEKDYKGALQEYAAAIRNFPTASGAAARVGLATAAYRLGQVDRAKAAFARARALDPEYVPALVGTALLDMRAITTQDRDFAARMEYAIKLLSVANLLNAQNAMVQNHLANHYFWKWTPVTGTVDVTQGSKLVTSAQNLPLDPGERIRIGTSFETTVVADAHEDENDDSTSRFIIAQPWTEASAKGLKLWKKDYDRVVALAKGAYSATAVDAVKAESLFFLARVYHVRGETENAHKFYTKACQLAADLGPARFGLAQTCLANRKYDDAAKNLLKVLQSSTNATDALGLLGLVQARTPATLEEGLGHLRKAMDLDPLNPEWVLWEALALQQYEAHYSKAIECYQKAIELLQRRKLSVKPQYYANCGVLCHETKKYEQSLEMYLKALVALDMDGTARKAQMGNKGLPGGRLQHPDNNMFFGFCDTSYQVARGSNEGGKKILTVTNVAQITDVPIESGDVIRLGADFETKVVAIRQDETEGTTVLIEIEDEYDPMDENVEPSSASDSPPTVTLAVQRENGLLQMKEATTIAFNIARLHEATGRILAAIELHKSIVKRNPAYVNSYLRLACIAVDCGSLKESSQWLRIAAETAPGNPEVLTLVGNLHLSLADWQPAQKVFDSLLVKKVPNVDAYASLSLGNIYFATLNASPSRYQKHLQYASDYYKRILSKDPANAYAANGLGTVLAEKADIFKAKEVFNRVREVSGDNIADTFINLGHIYLAQKKHPEALQMYKNYMKRAEDGTTPITSKSRVDDVVDVLLYISFAYFDWARHTESFNDANAAPADGRYKETISYLEQAIAKHSKKEVILRYNLCMTKLHAANCVLQKLTRNIPRTVEEVQEALDNLRESLQIVEKISEDKAAGQKINIPSSTLQDFLKHCRSNISSAESHLEDEKKRASEADQEREIRRLAAEAAAKEEQIRKAVEQAEEAKKQEERDAKAAEKMKKVQELRSDWEREQAKETEKAAKKKTGKAATDDFIVDVPEPTEGGGHGLFEDSDDDDDDYNNSAPAVKETKDVEKEGNKPTEEELFGSSDEEPEDGDKEAKSKPNKDANPFADSDDEDESPLKKPESEEAAPAPAAGAEGGDLFGGSSDEEIVKDDAVAKRPNPEVSDNQPKKKRKLVDEDGE
eukprot:scaffold1123_cov168-Amphora_coffeaeformis.AAC.11